MAEVTDLSDEQQSTAPQAGPDLQRPEESLVAAIDRVADPHEDSHWDLPTKRLVLVIMLVVIVFVIYVSRQLIPLLLIAAILAYLLSPIVNFAERFRIPRLVSTLLIFVLLITALILVPVLFLPTLIGQLRTLATFDVALTARSLFNWANDTIRSLPPSITIIGFEVPLHSLIEQVQADSQQTSFVPSVNDILSYIQQVLSATTNVVSTSASIGVSVVGGIFSAFLSVLVTFFVSVYMTVDAPRIQAYFHSLFPTSYRSELADLLRRIGIVWQSFLRGQLILSLVVGTMTWVALTLVGMPGALIFGILAGLLESVPNLGPILAMIPAVITALIQGSTVLEPLGVNNLGFALVTVGIYLLIQQTENNILVPRIIGDSINLHPIVVLCAVAVGLSVGGILGALLGAPIVATMRVVGSYVHAKLLDYPPFLGRPLPARKPVTYRRTTTGRALRAAARCTGRRRHCRTAERTCANPALRQ